MTKEELLKSISQPLYKTNADKLANILSKPESIDQLLELTFYPKKEIAFRSAWILETVYFKNPVGFVHYLNAFNDAYCLQTNLSCQRHFTKIMMDITSFKNEAYRLFNLNFEPVTDTTFEWLIDPKTPVAVQANCLDILYNLSRHYDWIKEELISQTEFLLRDGSAALQSRGKRVLGKLKDR
jgi:hypothetical protein